MNTVLVTGNTYPVKDQIKALGGKWDPRNKGWLVSPANAARAQALVSAAPSKAAPAKARSYRGRRTGCRCGSIEDFARDSDCESCQHDY